MMSPKLNEFYGIRVYMYYDDHLPPHIHAEYQGFEASVDFQRYEILSGKLPRRAVNLVMDWCELHEHELVQAWELAKNNLPLPNIFGLD
jgi:Domain of unknown function (DUF4160)